MLKMETTARQPTVLRFAKECRGLAKTVALLFAVGTLSSAAAEQPVTLNNVNAETEMLASAEVEVAAVTLKGGTSVTKNANGRMALFAVNSSGDVVTRHVQTEGGWSAWTELTNLPAAANPQPPGVARTAAGLLRVFVAAQDGGIYYKEQVARNGGWPSSWTRIGTVFATSRLAVSPDGRTVAFTRRSAAPSVRLYSQAADGTWTLSYPWETDSSISINSNSDPMLVSARGRLELFVIGFQNGYQVFNAYQTSSGWSSLIAMGSDLAEYNCIGCTSDYNYGPAVAVDGDDQIRVFARGRDGNLYSRGQADSDGTWYANWVNHGYVGVDPLGGNYPAAVKQQSGRLEVFVQTDDEIRHKWQTSTGWSAWGGMGGESTRYTPAVTLKGNGRLEIFTVTASGTVRHRWQTQDGTWSNWADLL